MLCANLLVKEMHKVETRCDSLLEETAEALNEDVLTLMLLAVQKADLGLSIRTAVTRCVFHVKNRERMQSHQRYSVHNMSLNEDTRDVILSCLIPFPQIWASICFGSHGHSAHT